MKLSLRSEYALMTLIEITRSGGAESVPASNFGKKIPADAVAEILSVLDNAGYLQKEKNRVSLAKKAQEISIAEIIRLFDGALAPLEPVSSKGYAPAPMDAEEKLSGLFEQLQSQIIERLENTWISDLV